MSKSWGKSEFWGLSEDWDPDFILTEKQKSIRNDLIELCRTKIRPLAIEYDKNYTYPRESMNALSELGLLGLTIPKELGGMGENNVCVVMVIETLARYGCPSTAMVYTMHITALSMILYRHHDNEHIKNLLKRVNSEKLIGTSVHSDPSTGGHFWFPLSSKSKMIDSENLRVLKAASWVTSAGFADWYAIETVSPEFKGNFADLSVFVIYKDEIRASTEDWSSLGLHGNQSGPMIVDVNIPKERMVGPVGDGANNNGEVGGIQFLLSSSSVWNGIALGCMDVAKKHVTRKAHADLGMRICDYPIIHNYFGQSICETNSCRSQLFFVAQQLDRLTDNNNWDIYKNDEKAMPRATVGFWLWQAKYTSSENVNRVSDRMIRACGGTGFKTETGIERLLRDGKAACLMAPTNEVIAELLGKASLIGMESLDFWEQKCNERVLNHEVGKLSIKDKRTLAYKLLEEVNQEEENAVCLPGQDTDFDNPFNTREPKAVETIEDKSGTKHLSALKPKEYTSLKLESKTKVNKTLTSFVFKYSDPTLHSGCYPGQYIQVKFSKDGKDHERYLSPVSPPDRFGNLEIVMRFETQGIISNYFKNLQIGDAVFFKGPCGGFEYQTNSLEELTILAAGAGITPGLQLLRCLKLNELDKTKMNLIYYSDSAEDILYKNKLDGFNDDPRIRVIYTLGEVPENWEGEEGFINTKMICQYIQKPNGLKHKIIICGGSTMTISCLHSLRTIGYPSDSIFIYGQFGVELIRSVYGRNAKLTTQSSN